MFKFSKLSTIYPLLLLVAVIAGYYLSKSASPVEHEPAAEEQVIKPTWGSYSEDNKPLSRSPQRMAQRIQDPPLPPFAISGERVARFNNREDYLRFLASLKGRGFNLLGKSDRLLSVRFGHGDDFNPDDLKDAEPDYNYLVTIPRPPDASAQPGAVGFGRAALAWLGIDGDISSWGRGVTVAVLDTGVNNHIALSQGAVTQVELTKLADGSEQLGHGTAVASIISGDHALTPGIAPSADILSYRITDETGTADSFTLAQGILSAADAGAKVINISMGTFGNSSVVEDAVVYAQQKGAVIVASAGNEGLETIAYPAAYDGVIAVGAVEASGEHLDFSNSSKELDIVAPGYQVNAAWGDEQMISFSGTSASAPFISGAIAAAMSENPNLSAQQAAELVLGVTNDAGYPGNDPDYGSGILAMDRVMEYGTANIYDAAITSQVLVPPTDSVSLPQVLVTVQNQGTATLINSPINITTPTGTRTLNISSLAPGQIQTFPVTLALPPNGSAATVSSSVQTVEVDQEPDNNSRSDSFLQTNQPE
ncbi:MAG: S8 family serine peptidase [Verrucomicrobiae bacterium]|nr:S8 family serine peptidase [Verrucomicrobiae bacterium]NNJ86783.1 S8 family serine peptidase [Akkermansiaceae bacterium]